MRSLDETRQTLMARRDALLRRRAATLAEEQELLDAHEPDWEDLAADQTQARLLDRISESELFELYRINDALFRIQHGGYGRCVACGRAIDDDRIQVIPEAPRCSGCTNSH